MTQDDARNLVRQIQFAAQKCRSNAVESLGSDDVSLRVLADLNPRLDPDNDLNIVMACERMLADDRDVTGGDLYNLLTLVGQEPSIGMWWLFHGDGELPTPREALEALA